MNSKFNIHYTDSAMVKLEAVQNELKDYFEKFIRDQKYTPGEDVLEITASDIEYARRKIDFISNRTSNYRNLISKVYFIIGIVMAFVGIFFNEIKSIISSDPTRLSIIASGIGLAIMGILLRYITNKYSYKRELDELLKRKQEIIETELEMKKSSISELYEKYSKLTTMDELSESKIYEIRNALEHLNRALKESQK